MDTNKRERVNTTPALQQFVINKRRTTERARRKCEFRVKSFSMMKAEEERMRSKNMIPVYHQITLDALLLYEVNTILAAAATSAVNPPTTLLPRFDFSLFEFETRVRKDSEPYDAVIPKTKVTTVDGLFRVVRKKYGCWADDHQEEVRNVLISGNMGITLGSEANLSGGIDATMISDAPPPSVIDKLASVFQSMCGMSSSESFAAADELIEWWYMICETEETADISAVVQFGIPDSIMKECVYLSGAFGLPIEDHCGLEQWMRKNRMNTPDPYAQVRVFAHPRFWVERRLQHIVATVHFHRETVKCKHHPDVRVSYLLALRKKMEEIGVLSPRHIAAIQSKMAC